MAKLEYGGPMHLGGGDVLTLDKLHWNILRFITFNYRLVIFLEQNFLCILLVTFTLGPYEMFHLLKTNFPG